jgi:hypothetical protein
MYFIEFLKFKYIKDEIFLIITIFKYKFNCIVSKNHNFENNFKRDFYKEVNFFYTMFSCSKTFLKKTLSAINLILEFQFPFNCAK